MGRADASAILSPLEMIYSDNPAQDGTLPGLYTPAKEKQVNEW
jgi:hypothetical protein